jgi:hypothetical protein
MLLVTLLLWVAGLWAGWSLVLLGDPSAVADAMTHAPATVAQVIYFAGFTVFTLGVGDYVPTSDTWRVVTALASFSGLFLVTLAITYLVSVVSAVVQRRSIAVQVNALGDSPAAIVASGWTGSGFSSAFVQHLVNLTGELATSAEQHLAYPTLHFFHTPDRRAASPLAVTALDEALLVLRYGVAPEHRPATLADPAQRALDRYLKTATGPRLLPAVAAAPPPPDLQPVRCAGVPLVDDATFAAAVADRESHRRALRQLVQGNGWTWPF